ncbi:MAG: hypothetical protein PHU80_12115, partial [Kiritimatiellae bacterium]|nr:hypothetical protein [Kiritimatiellia bacterium]
SFQGTGAIDEFVIADEADLGGGAAVMLTLTWAEADIGLFTVKQNGSTVTRDSQIESGSAIEVVANDWYELASISGTGITIAETDGNDNWYTEAGVANDSLLTNFVGTVTANDTGLTATIDAQQFTGTLPASTGLEGVSASDLAAWAVLNKYSLAEIVTGGEAYYNAFLLDVPKGTDDTIAITSITVDSGTGEVTITVEAVSALVDLGNINGCLSVVTSDTLPVSGEPTYIPFNAPGGVATIVIPNSGKFIKVTVEATQPVPAE